MDKKRIERALSNWYQLIQEIPDMTEEELHHALTMEKSSDEPRKSFIDRLYQVYSSRRRKREKSELHIGE